MQNQTDSKNLILAVVISIIIMTLWQVFIVDPQLEEQREQLAREKKAQEDVILPEVKTFEEKQVSRDEIITGSKFNRIKINNGKLHGSISLKGARFDDLTLAEYKNSLKEDAKEVILLSPSGTKQQYFAEFGWLAGRKGLDLPNKNTIWQADKQELNEGQTANLFWDNKDGVRFKLAISLDENYMFSIKQEVVNNSASALDFYPYGAISRNKEIDEDEQNLYILHKGMLGVIDDVLEEYTYDDMIDDKEVNFKSATGWFGITDKYWLTAIVPDKSNSFDINFKYAYRNNKNMFQSDYLGQLVNVAAGQSHESSQHFFAGAKKVGLLDQYEKNLDINLFDRAVDFGWLYFITKPIFKALKFFNDLLGNFGLAILLLTVCIKLALFPLANKSYVSMHHMKRIQPKLMDMKERYKNDRVAMNQEVMKLYKEEKINPMSGCLPILVQIPIFFALYKVLFVTIEMRHAPFYGWISDLSAPDPTNMFTLFGLFDWSLPAFLHIGIWPILMGLTMIIQQKLNPQPQDKTQAMVMKFLPYVFVFLFATFPVGLVIYWAWNNILSIIQQWFITRNLPQQ